jgi:hypothetical protein
LVRTESKRDWTASQKCGQKAGEAVHCTVQSTGAGAGEVYNQQLSQNTEQERQGSEQESLFREQLGKD